MNSETSNKFIQSIIFVAVFLIGLFLYSKFGPGLPLSVNQITTNKNDLFTVSGEGKVTVKPDIAQVNFGVSTTGPTVAQVQSQSNQAINKVLSAIKKLGVAETDIKTTNYNIYPQYASEPITIMGAPQAISSRESDLIAPSSPPVPIKPGTPKITGYSMNINVTVKVRDLSKVNQIVDVATANGANQMNGISFTLDKPEQYESEARKLAIADAKKKAEELSSAAGIQLGRVVGIFESSDFPRPYAMDAKADSGGDGSQTQIEPGSSEITLQVTLNYETR